MTLNYNFKQVDRSTCTDIKIKAGYAASGPGPRPSVFID